MQPPEWGTNYGAIRMRLFSRRGSSSPASSPPDPFDVARYGRPAVRVYTDQNGIPMNAVMALALDTKGYLWVGTQDGAAVYNGRAWRVVDMPDRTRSNFVRALLATSDGALWFGTEGGGLVRLDGGR